jgi:hypothetical protein
MPNIIHIMSTSTHKSRWTSNSKQMIINSLYFITISHVNEIQKALNAQYRSIVQHARKMIAPILSKEYRFTTLQV